MISYVARRGEDKEIVWPRIGGRIHHHEARVVRQNKSRKHGAKQCTTLFHLKGRPSLSSCLTFNRNCPSVFDDPRFAVLAPSIPS